jgi:hypothetical protein
MVLRFFVNAKYTKNVTGRRADEIKIVPFSIHVPTFRRFTDLM